MVKEPERAAHPEPVFWYIPLTPMSLVNQPAPELENGGESTIQYCVPALSDTGELAVTVSRVPETGKPLNVQLARIPPEARRYRNLARSLPNS